MFLKDSIYEFDEIYKCECDGHFLRITKFKGEPQVNFSKFSENTSELPLLTRIRLAIGFIFNPSKYDIHGDVIFDYKTTKRMARDLLKVSQDKNPNLITGQEE